MNGRKWLILSLAIVTIMSLATYTGVTRSLFVDDEKSTNDALGIRWGLFTLNDGFEGSPWDDNWDENGSSIWQQDSGRAHSGTYAARGRETEAGYLTTDDMYAASSTSITVNFWYNPNTSVSDCLIETYNGTDWNTWWDLTTHGAWTNDNWCEFTDTITDSQYFIAGFRLRFNNTGMIDGTDAIWNCTSSISTEQCGFCYCYRS